MAEGKNLYETVIVTSAKLTAEEALVLHKSRDGSEKTFQEKETGDT